MCALSIATNSTPGHCMLSSSELGDPAPSCMERSAATADFSSPVARSPGISLPLTRPLHFSRGGEGPMRTGNELKA